MYVSHLDFAERRRFSRFVHFCCNRVPRKLRLRENINYVLYSGLSYVSIYMAPLPS